MKRSTPKTSIPHTLISTENKNTRPDTISDTVQTNNTVQTNYTLQILRPQEIAQALEDDASSPASTTSSPAPASFSPAPASLPKQSPLRGHSPALPVAHSPPAASAGTTALSPSKVKVRCFVRLLARTHIVRLLARAHIVFISAHAHLVVNS